MLGVAALWLTWPKNVAAALGVALAGWAGGGALVDFSKRARLFEKHALARIASLPRNYVAMTIGHFGFAIVAIGVLGVGAFKSETIAYAREGDVVSVGGYDAKLLSVTQSQGPNYASEFAAFDISKNGRPLASMTAERRFYPVRGMQTTEAAIATDLAGDLYLTVGDFNEERGWVVRAWRHPLTIWMWIGAALIALGGVVGLVGEKRRATARTAIPADAKTA